MTNLSSQPYKGTRDYYPQDKRVQNYIFDTWKSVVAKFGYVEYSTPLLEPLDIYTAKSGQELATEQTYTFSDRGGRNVAIRPEMTPSVSRMVASRRQEWALPMRLFSIANFMRYERPQRGREREFWQLNVDIFGAEGVPAEAEMISMAYEMLKSFDASDDMFVIKINNRKLINFVMANYFGLDVVQAQAMVRLLDRKSKMDENTFYDQARDIFGEIASDDGMAKLEIIITAKNMADLPIEIKNSGAVQEVKELFTLLDRLGVANAVFDITLMRGLDYYSGMVFEVFDTDPENNRSLFGGGRYDGLVGLFGVEPLSAVGFAPGLSTMELFLTSHKLIPDYVGGQTVNAYVIAVGGNMSHALSLASVVRQQGWQIEVDVTERKIDKQIKSALSKNIRYVIFVGDAEVTSQQFTVRNLETGEEIKSDIDGINHIFSSAPYNAQ